MKKIVIMILCMVLILSACTKKNVDEVPVNQEYKSEKYKVSLNYPVEWTLNSAYGERYELAGDGYFSVQVIVGDQEADIMDIAKVEGEHTLLPYGTSPTYEKLKVDEQEAVRIKPSADQNKDMAKQTGIIIKYPKSVIIDDTEYNFLYIVGDDAHLDEIISTIQLTK